MSERCMDLLQARFSAHRFVCVGLDSDAAKLPHHLRQGGQSNPPQFTFNREIIDATASVACAFKPNMAFYQEGRGLEALELTVDYIHHRHPEIPVIGDGKWGDIGNTNLGYVKGMLDTLGFDAVTVSPYLGMEAMKPFLDREEKGVIVLVKTSNVGAGEFQDLNVEVARERRGGDITHEHVDHLPLYQVIARAITERWNYSGNCAVVAGATYPKELAVIRGIIGDMPMLIPGIGSQGGDLEAAVSAAVSSIGGGMIINSSRGIIFASEGLDFADMARNEALKLNKAIIAAIAAASPKET